MRWKTMGSPPPPKYEFRSDGTFFYLETEIETKMSTRSSQKRYKSSKCLGVRGDPATKSIPLLKLEEGIRRAEKLS